MNIPAWLDLFFSAIVFLALSIEIYDNYRLREKLRKMSSESIHLMRDKNYWYNAYTSTARNMYQMRDRLVQKNKRMRGLIDKMKAEQVK